MAWPQEIETGELKLLHAFVRGCHAEYSLICKDGLHEIKATDFFQIAICVFGETIQQKSFTFWVAPGIPSLHQWPIFWAGQKHRGRQLGDLCFKRFILEFVDPSSGSDMGCGDPCAHLTGRIHRCIWWSDRERWRWKSWEILNTIFLNSAISCHPLSSSC